jgi:hypothetical protein
MYHLMFTPVRMPLAGTTLRSDDPLILIGGLSRHPGEDRGAIRGHRHLTDLSKDC